MFLLVHLTIIIIFFYNQPRYTTYVSQYNRTNSRINIDKFDGTKNMIYFYVIPFLKSKLRALQDTGILFIVRLTKTVAYARSFFIQILQYFIRAGFTRFYTTPRQRTLPWWGERFMTPHKISTCFVLTWHVKYDERLFTSGNEPSRYILDYII